MFFWNSLAFLMIQQMLAIWSLVPLAFLNPAWTSRCSRFTYCWSLTWRILSITLLACEMNATVQEFEHSLALSFFGIGMKTDLFRSCGHCWVFQTCWRRGDHKRLQEIFFGNGYVQYLDCCWFHGCVVVQLPSRVWLWDPMDCSMPGLPVPHHLPEFAQVHVHCISDTVQPSHLLTSSSPSALNLSQHQRLFFFFLISLYLHSTLTEYWKYSPTSQF